jgi:hypothetical protein
VVSGLLEGLKLMRGVAVGLAFLLGDISKPTQLDSL